MLDEKEFFIRKAIGWVLREHGKKRPDRVAAFVEEHRGRMAGLTLVATTGVHRPRKVTLLEAAKTCSLGQLSGALYEVGGQYRRNM